MFSGPTVLTHSELKVYLLGSELDNVVRSTQLFVLHKECLLCLREVGLFTASAGERLFGIAAPLAGLPGLQEALEPQGPREERSYPGTPGSTTRSLDGAPYRIHVQ